MTKLTAIKKITQWLNLRYRRGTETFRVYGIEDFAGGWIVKFWREYPGMGTSRHEEDRIAFFYYREDYPNEVQCKFDMIAR